jgi:hypothetical protein
MEHDFVDSVLMAAETGNFELLGFLSKELPAAAFRKACDS